ncbi:MAG TPA: Asp-tRNA(Asn)/Glu-tRNA(Gln) amidotransferase subunit GatC [Candidatus Limnocylindria bacterium]|nr:Asp-tRNA(Asn)/Glu-tRNA(Gln) amidotransferase subunit GatC [Candidatus Limnocylindria bacterium]
MISREEVEHVALLARLGLTDDEIDRMQAQLSHILETIAQLADVDTSAIDPTAQVIELENVLRDDLPRPALARDTALGNAPQREGPMLRVAEVLEEGR